METILEPQKVEAVRRAVPLLLSLPMERYWVDYDREADVLYISFRRPQRATDTRMTADGVLLRYHGKELVGMTVLEASTRSQVPSAASKEPRPATPKRRRPEKKHS